MVVSKELPHPILKWAGGKSSIIPTYVANDLIPHDFNKYFEPFFGAGAMYFFLWRHGKIVDATLSDINIDLYNVYNQVKKSCDELIQFASEIDLNPVEPYYRHRERFNELKSKPLNVCTKEEKLERAVLMIYLNRTGYSGMYRENKKGQFNVPCGFYKNPTIIDEANLKAVSESLQTVKLKHEDYKKVVSKAKNHDYVYFDPPYMPFEDVSNFRDYHRSGFDNEEQSNLCMLFGELDQRGCLEMISNSSNPELNQMYTTRVPHSVIHVVDASRLINQKNVGRVKVKEYVITNY